MQFIKIILILLLLLLYVAYADMLLEIKLWCWFNSVNTEFLITSTDTWSQRLFNVYVLYQHVHHVVNVHF